MTPETFAKIVAWLYTSHQAFPSAVNWREAFVEFLQSLVEPQEVYGEVDSENAQGYNEHLGEYVRLPLELERLSLEEKTVNGKIRTAKEILDAIPGWEDFQYMLKGMKEPTFFEINKKGQLVMMDGCAEAYGLGDDYEAAKKRQTRIVKQGNKILMEKGLPTWEEYQRMNKGQFERETNTWVEDGTITDISYARHAYWDDDRKCVGSDVFYSNYYSDNFGSRGVLRVNLDFKS